jgi:hypothetical protein
VYSRTGGVQSLTSSKTCRSCILPKLTSERKAIDLFYLKEDRHIRRFFVGTASHRINPSY